MLRYCLLSEAGITVSLLIASRTWVTEGEASQSVNTDSRKSMYSLTAIPVECTGSLSTSEVKRHRARLVLGWGTAWEDLRVLSAFDKHRVNQRTRSGYGQIEA
jgi:hypothetical protein